jgi:CelD/BcsL family acetyltransferase involved in cellulose biosynthesis
LSTPDLTVRRVAPSHDLNAAWRRLLHQSPTDTIFLTPEWQRRWWETIGEGEPHLLLVESGAEPVGLAPLVRVGGRWQVAGGAEVADFLDFLAAPAHAEAVADVMVDYLEARGGCLELRNLRPNALAATVLVAVLRRRGAPAQLAPEEVSPRLALPRDWDSYLQQLTKKDRHELRRKLRRLEAQGDVRYGRAVNPASRSADLDDFLRLHRLSAEDKAAFMTPAMERFFRAIADEFLPSGQLRLYFLEVGGIRAAAVLLFDYGGAFLLYNSGYDPAFASLSVGLLLKAFCIQDAIAEGKHTFDFLQGAEPYKYDLGGGDLPILRLRARLPAGRTRASGSLAPPVGRSCNRPDGSHRDWVAGVR